MVTLLGQYHSDASQERLYNQLSFGTYYSTSPDAEPPIIAHIDGVLNETTGIGHIKVEATDTSGVIRVLVAHTDGQGEWHSQDLTYDDSMRKWTGAISGTTQTRYFVQIVDGAGNVAIDDNKGQYRSLSRPLPLILGSEKRLFLPLIMKNG